MKRENRRYKLTFFVQDKETLVIEYPFKIRFNAIEKLNNLKGGLNELNLQIYNLSSSNRLKLVVDESSKDKKLRVVFEVGYDDELRIVYQGTVYSGEVSKSGTDYINTINCKDGGNDFINKFITTTVKTKNQVIEEILKKCDSLKKGKITIDKDYLKAKPLFGNVGKVLLELPNEDEEMFISKEKLYLIKKNDVISKYVPLVNADSGLISASRQNKTITAITLFNPSLSIGMYCKLESIVNPYLNGQYKIYNIKYTGDTDGNEWTMEVLLTEPPKESKK